MTGRARWSSSFPKKPILRRRAYFHSLDLTKDAPTRLLATDRKADQEA